MGYRFRSVAMMWALALLLPAGLAGCSSDPEPSFAATIPTGQLGRDTVVDQTGRYRCAGTQVSIDELENLAGLPMPDAAQFEEAAQVLPLGTQAEWAVLASGWIVDRRPLEAGGYTGLLVIDPSIIGPVGCVPVTTLEPRTAWRHTEPLLSASGPDQAALDGARCSAEATTEGIAVSWWDVPAGTAWEIIGDGSFLIGGAIDPESLLATVLDGARNERMASRGPGPGPLATAGTLPTEPATPQGAFGDLGALGLPPGTVRTYKLHLTTPSGERTVSCGSAAIPAQLPVPPCTLSLFAGHPQIELAHDPGDPPYSPDVLTIRRDGEVITLGNQWGPPFDVTAEPGSTHHYEVEIRDRSQSRPPVPVDCGSITAATPASDADILRAGAEVFDRVILATNLYATGELDGRPVELVLESTGSGFEFAPGHPANESLNPYTVHQQLLDAIEAGRAVTFEIDPPTGLPRRWTIDGVVRAYTCVNTDSQPPDLRPTTRCDEAADRLEPESGT